MALPQAQVPVICVLPNAVLLQSICAHACMTWSCVCFVSLGAVDFKDLELSQQLGAGSFGSVWLAQYCQTTGEL